MKSFRKIYSLILFSFACLLGLNACSSDEEGTEPPQKEKQLVMAISYEPSEDLLAVADIKLTYTDGYGQKHTEAVKKKFEKSVIIVAFPINAGYEISVTPKTSYEKKEHRGEGMGEHHEERHSRHGTPQECEAARRDRHRGTAAERNAQHEDLFPLQCRRRICGRANRQYLRPFHASHRQSGVLQKY